MPPAHPVDMVALRKGTLNGCSVSRQSIRNFPSFAGGLILRFKQSSPRLVPSWFPHPGSLTALYPVPPQPATLGSGAARTGRSPVNSPRIDPRTLGLAAAVLTRNLHGEWWEHCGVTGTEPEARIPPVRVGLGRWHQLDHSRRFCPAKC